MCDTHTNKHSMMIKIRGKIIATYQPALFVMRKLSFGFLTVNKVVLQQKLEITALDFKIK